MFLSRLWILISLAIGAASETSRRSQDYTPVQTEGTEDKYKKLGGDAVLSPSAVSDRISSITWKHGPDIAVEWYGQEPVSYRDFKGRCKLDFNTGALTISNVTVKDSGIYTAEINNKVMNPTEITVISAVPKPTVSTQCSSEGTRCTFTCEASITGAEPVTYSWMVDGKNITGSSKSLQKEKDDPEMVGKPISCQLKNPVSNEHSDDVFPFPNSYYVGLIIGVVVAFVIVIAVAVGLFIWCRRRRGSQNFNGDAGHCFACFTKRSSETSRRSQDYTPVQTEGTEEPPGRSQEDTPGQTEEGADDEKAQISTSNGTVAYMKAGEIHNQEQNSESTQSKHEPDEKAQISTSNGTVAYTTVDEMQNSESTQSKHEPEPPGRSQEDTPGQTEEGAEEENAQISTSNGNDTSEEGTLEL